MGNDVLIELPWFVKWAMSHAEFLAFGLNAFMTLAFLIQRDAPRVVYWFGATMAISGVIMLGRTGH